MWEKINLKDTETIKLLEATKNTFLSKSRNVGEYKDKSKGKNRFERQKYSTIPEASKQFNQIDMNKLFKEDELLVKIPVIGETDNYQVTIRLHGVIKKIIKINLNLRQSFKLLLKYLILATFM